MPSFWYFQRAFDAGAAVQNGPQSDWSHRRSQAEGKFGCVVFPVDLLHELVLTVGRF